MKYAWEYQLKGSKERKIVEAIKVALYWEQTIHLEEFEASLKKFMLDPKTGELIPRLKE